MKLYYHHVGILGAKEDFKKTVFGKVPISVVRNNVDDKNPNKHEMLETLIANFPDGQFNCWGVPSGASNIINNLNTSDAVLLVESTSREGRIPALCKVVGFWKDEFNQLSNALWGNDKYPYIFFFRTEKLNLMWEEFLTHMGYKPKWDPRGKFYSVADSKLDSFGGAERYVEYLRANYAESIDLFKSITIADVEKELGSADEQFVNAVEQEVFNIKQLSLDNVPELTEGAVKKVKTVIEKPRSAAFRISVKKLYKNKCAICGYCLLSPDGKPALESAHLYPKEFDGSDDFRNGVCLCKLHHWALDSGWFSIADDYTVIVRTDLPLAEEYNFIRKYEGQEITLPEQIEFAPHPLFLRAHRKLKGFE